MISPLAEITHDGGDSGRSYVVDQIKRSPSGSFESPPPHTQKTSGAAARSHSWCADLHGRSITCTALSGETSISHKPIKDVEKTLIQKEKPADPLRVKKSCIYRTVKIRLLYNDLLHLHSHTEVPEKNKYTSDFYYATFPPLHPIKICL